MTDQFGILQRSAILIALCIAAIAYLATTLQDETVFKKTGLNAPGNTLQAAFNNAVKTGIGVVAFKPSLDGRPLIQSRTHNHIRAAFVLKAYAFLRKLWTAPLCSPLRMVKLVSHFTTRQPDSGITLKPCAELTITREQAKQVDWSSDFSKLGRFKVSIAEQATLHFDPASVP